MERRTPKRTWMEWFLLAAIVGCASPGKTRKVDETIRGGQTVTPSEFQDEEKNYAGDLAPLEHADVTATMRALQPQVHRCTNKHNEGGTTTFIISVAAGGKVRAVRSEGGFAGSPQAECIAKVIQAAAFPPCAPTTFPYPLTINAR